MNHVMMYAGMVRRNRQQCFKIATASIEPGERLPVGSCESAHDGERQKSLRLYIVTVRAYDPSQTLDILPVGIG